MCRGWHPASISVVWQWERRLHSLVYSADRVYTNTKGLLPSNERVYKTYSLFLMVVMGCGIIIILLEVASTISSMGWVRSTSLCKCITSPNFFALRIQPKQRRIGPRWRTRCKRLEKGCALIQEQSTVQLTFLCLQRFEWYLGGLQGYLMWYEYRSLGTTFWSDNFPTYSLRLTSRIFKMQHGHRRNVFNFPLRPDLRLFVRVDITHIKSSPEKEG